eukprot:GEMP01048713.1.p1 GENE.GEMP01048713.1~~GEMP01048713.1.p1  ORF type:complete len:316 (+),score=1.56 GEMP01048713.1:155-1102(+)
MKVKLAVGIATCSCVIYHFYTGSVNLSKDVNFSTPWGMHVAAENSYLNPYKDECLKIADLKSGDKVLDLGAGYGHMQQTMARLVAPGGEVVAIEPNNRLREIAINHVDRSGIDPRIVKHVDRMVAPGLPILNEANYFDVAYSGRVLCNMKDSDFALDEMIRVTKPGGKIIIACEDFTTISSSSLGVTYEAVLSVGLYYLFLLLGRDGIRYVRDGTKLLKQRSEIDSVKRVIQIAHNSHGYEWEWIYGEEGAKGMKHQVVNIAKSIDKHFFFALPLAESATEYLITPAFDKVLEDSKNGNYFDSKLIMIYVAEVTK